MDSEGIVKTVDGIYKNILEKFNPGSKHLIASAKSYLKTLHAVSAASKVFNESLAKLAVNAHEGGTTDIGSALMNIVGVFSSIEDQHMNILKAFYVDFIVPLETNLEKDTKVIQHEQKRFMQQHKQRIESFNKASQAMKKNRKKKNNAEKELKCIQALEEEKRILDEFCDQSLKNALIQERRRYGFVLERYVQCLAKHWAQYHNAGQMNIENNMESWIEVASTREILPFNVEKIISKRAMNHNGNESDDNVSVVSALRKSQSIDAASGSLGDIIANGNYHQMQMSMPRATSEYNLTSSPQENNNKWNGSTVTALYAYLSSGENQLSFFEGDQLALVGERIRGWQFGENLRTQKFGWFPVSYIFMPESRAKSISKNDKSSETSDENANSSAMRRSAVEMVEKKEDSFNRFNRVDSSTSLPPSTVPPPPPQKTFDGSTKSGSMTANFTKPSKSERQEAKPSMHAIYSSNDSGFSNELPPAAPEVDYSDDDVPSKIPIRGPLSEKNMHVSSDVEDDVYGAFPKASMNIKSSNSFGNLTETARSNMDQHHSFNIDSTTVKRNKSFWRFSKSEDILEGMALWKHRDLIQTENENIVDKEATLKKQMKQQKQTLPDQMRRDRNSTNDLSTLKKKSEKSESKNKRYEKSLSKYEIDKRVNEMNKQKKNVRDSKNKQQQRGSHPDEFDDGEDLYDETPKRRNDGTNSNNKRESMKIENMSMELQDTNFYDDEVVLMKTVRRKDILKQYYSSGTDTEVSSSDPYDCVVDDHSVPTTSSVYKKNKKITDETESRRDSSYAKPNKNELSGTLLPRTKLSKSSRSNVESNERNDAKDKLNTARSNGTTKSRNSFGPWTDLWPDERNY